MIFEQVSMGGDRNFGYLIGDEKSGEAAIVDPAYNPARLTDMAKEKNLNILYIINTHDHHDHVSGNTEAKAATGAEITIHEAADIGCDKTIKDGDVLKVGSLELKIIHTPGHSPDSICIMVENKLITGDTLYVDKIGGTMNEAAAKDQFDSLFEKLGKLGDDVEIYAAHDVGSMPSSTLGRERKENYFLTRTEFKDFLWLKDNWAQFKAENNIE